LFLVFLFLTWLSLSLKIAKVFAMSEFPSIQHTCYRCLAAPLPPSGKRTREAKNLRKQPNLDLESKWPRCSQRLNCFTQKIKAWPPTFPRRGIEPLKQQGLRSRGSPIFTLS
jgi:hypothetical protein